MYSSMFPATDKPLLKRAIKAASKGKDALKVLLKYYEDVDETLQASASEDDFD